MPRLLDLFCGAGGAGMGYSRAGFDVVGVDHLPQPRYPFEFIEDDALSYLEGLIFDRRTTYFDLIHASPPCQDYSALLALQNGKQYEQLIPPIRDLLQQSGAPYVIENMVGAPLIDPVLLCGSSFGLGVRRHRIFETYPPVYMRPPCAHHGTEPLDVTGTGGPGGRHRKPKNMKQASEAMGIDWMKRKELTQAIPPAYCEFIGRELLRQMQG